MNDPSRDALIFLPLGGAGEIGMNLNLYGQGGKWLMVDCGVMLADESMPGVDLLVPDPAWIAARSGDLIALILTHAHEDHLGAVPYLWPHLRCPVYATAFAAEVLKAKLADMGLTDAVPITIFAAGDRLELAPFRVRAIGITHSIPESLSLAIETPLGLVLHTGDWKLDPNPLVGAETDAPALIEAGEAGVLALVCDSTNAMVPGESGSEAAVQNSLMEFLRGRAGRIAVTTFASNIARMTTLAAVAEAHGRHLCLVGRSLWRFQTAARAAGYLAGIKPFLTEHDVGYLPPNKVLLMCTGCQGEARGAMARIASGDHPRVKLGPGDVAVFAARIIPGNERALARLHNRLAETGVEVVTERDHFVHVSGHPARDELAQMYRWIRPRIAIPVHGESRHMIAHAKLAKSLQVPEAIVLRNGQALRLAPGRPEVIAEVPSGRLAVDGKSLVSPQGPLMRARRRLGHNGTVMASLMLGPDDALLAPPALSLSGVAEGEEGPLAGQVAAAVAADFAKLTRRMRRDDRAIEDATRQVIAKTLRDAVGRRPVIGVHILRSPRLDSLAAARPDYDEREVVA